MPVQINSSGIIENDLDVEKEIRSPAQSGFYLEALARLDAYIDTLIDSVLRQVYSQSESLELLDLLEATLPPQRLFVTGNVKLDVLKKARTRKHVPDEKLYRDIREFKQKRNAALHSPYGHYALISARGTNDEFQNAARHEISNLIENGIHAYNALKKVYATNANPA